MEVPRERVWQNHFLSNLKEPTPRQNFFVIIATQQVFAEGALEKPSHAGVSE
eukprot:m.48933 g.48933  ORF g.48933 m.48933 type:complete len:52 (-) comp47840_c0_seq1:1281-1436(-)